MSVFWLKFSLNSPLFCITGWLEFLPLSIMFISLSLGHPYGAGVNIGLIHSNEANVMIMDKYITLSLFNNTSPNQDKLEIVDQWSTRIPPPQWRGWQWAMGGLKLNIVQNHKAAILKATYHKSSNIRCTLVGNKIVDHSDVVGASPVSAAPTTSSFST